MNDKAVDEERVVRTIQTVLGVKSAPSTLVMNELPEWDSLGHMQIAAALEDQFSVEFPSWMLADLKDVPAIVKLIAQLKGVA